MYFLLSYLSSDLLQHFQTNKFIQYYIDTIHIPRNNKKQFNLTVEGDHGKKLTQDANRDSDRDIIYQEV